MSMAKPHLRPKNPRPADASRALARPQLKPRGQLVPPRRQKPERWGPPGGAPSRESRAAGAPATRPLGPRFAPPKRELKAPFPDRAGNFPDPPIYSLIGRKKFPVRMRRELARKTLIWCP